MKYIAKEDLNCAFGILKVGDSFEADPKDERVAQLMVAGKVVADEAEIKSAEKQPKARRNAKKAKEEVTEETPETEPEATEETAEAE